MIKVNNKTIKFTSFPNGETNMDHNSFPDLGEKCGSDIYFKYEDDRDLIRLMFVRDYIRDRVSDLHELHLTISYMPYSRMDRSVDGSPFTLKYVADFINSLGFDGVQVIEPHSDRACELLWDSYSSNVSKRLQKDVLKEISFDFDRDYILYPDEGSEWRYRNSLHSNVLVGNKVRNFETGAIEELEIIGEVKKGAKKALIIDDICSYGGTFIRSAKRLRELGFEEVYLLVAHAENSIFKGELFNHIDKVFTTDSILTHNHSEKLKVYELESLLDNY